MSKLVEPVAPLQEHADQEVFPCRHCDDPVVQGVHHGVWQHDNGHWRCTDADTLAEPER